MDAKMPEYEYSRESSQGGARGSKKRNDEIITRIDLWIRNIERLIVELLNGIRIDDLSSYQRLNIAVRFIGQYQHLLSLRQAYDIEESVNHEQELVTRLMREMRGEDVEED
jgi:hypothetical protein